MFRLRKAGTRENLFSDPHYVRVYGNTVKLVELVAIPPGVVT